jgi:transketolase
MKYTSGGSDLIILSTGTIISNVLAAAERLEADGHRVRVFDVTVLKPFDNIGILDALAGNKIVVTVEEHNVICGLGSMVANLMKDAMLGMPLIKIGLNDSFFRGYGTEEGVRGVNGLDADSIYKRIVGFMDGQGIS